jgi:hypothetical protein
MSGSRSSFATACFASALAALGCGRATDAARAPGDAAVASTTGANVIDAGPLAGDASVTGDAAGDPLAGYSTADVVSGKSIGHTSIVFKLRLEGGLEAAYKPRSKRGGDRYKGEIAAYRVARALGLDNVPPAMPRRFTYEALQRALAHEPAFAEVIADDDGTVRGAIIPWIKGLEFSDVDQRAAIDAWRAQLRASGPLPDDRRALLAQISTMLAFDRVTGNWDRWSGGNVGLDRAKGELLFVDNDGAFFDPPPAKALAWPNELASGVDRFSRRLVDGLATLDVRAAVGDEAPGKPLLSARVIAQTEARRAALVTRIDAKRKALGDDAVLVFE